MTLTGKVTGKIKVFADAVFIGKSNKEAAILAGYSAKTASQAGSRLVKDRRVVAYLAARRLDAARPAENPVRVPEVPPDSDRHAAPNGATKACPYDDPKQFLIDQMNDVGLEDKLRQDAAKALLPFVHPKMGEGGKKESKTAAAKSAGAGRFGPAAPPRLATSGGKSI